MRSIGKGVLSADMRGITFDLKGNCLGELTQAAIKYSSFHKMADSFRP